MDSVDGVVFVNLTADYFALLQSGVVDFNATVLPCFILYLL